MSSRTATPTPCNVNHPGHLPAALRPAAGDFRMGQRRARRFTAPLLTAVRGSHRQRPAPKTIDEPAECQEHLAAVAERIPQLRAQM